jgi:hypothetical protein
MYWSFENRNYPLQTDKRKRHIDQIVRSLMIVFYLKKLMRCLAAIIRSSFSFGRILFNFLYERDMEGFQFPTTIKLSYTFFILKPDTETHFNEKCLKNKISVDFSNKAN